MEEDLIHKNKEIALMLGATEEQWYLHVNINTLSSRKLVLVHRLIALTWIKNPENKLFINHKDGNKQNNRADNLEWCTTSENMQHSWDIGLRKRKIKNTFSGEGVDI